MDVPDIVIVVQWRETCKLVQLWQRWGWAARACEQTRTAILFAEKDLFDNMQEEKLKSHRKKRQRWDSQGELELLPPKHSTLSGTNEGSIMCEGQNMNTNTPGPSLAFLSNNSNLKLRNSMLPSSSTTQGGEGMMKKVKKELDPAMDCLINADFQGVMCQQKVIEIYFNSKSISEFPILEENFALIL